MRIDRPGEAGEADDVGAPGPHARTRSDADAPDPSPSHGEKASGDVRPAWAPAGLDAVARTESSLASRAAVDAVYRQYAIDQGCARTEKLERERVTPAMRRIEAEDPERILVGMEHRLKGRDRIEEKVTHDIKKKGLTAEQAFAGVKDAIRYTFCYPEEKYAEGVQADARRLKSEGAEFADSRNTWTSVQYKGINSWWRIGGTGQLFEVQFHTQASYEAKQQTHSAYERLRTLPEDSEEVRELRTYQRTVNAKIPVPPGAADIVLT